MSTPSPPGSQPASAAPVSEVAGSIQQAGRRADGARAEADNGAGRVALGEVLEQAAGQAFGPLLLIPALIAMLPVIGAIPGMSILCGTLLALVAVQVLLGRRRPWLPRRLLRLEIRRAALQRGVAAAKPWLRRLDGLVGQRLTWMTREGGRHLAMLCVLGMAALMYPMALMPFGVMLPAGAVFIIALGITAGDGGWVGAGCLAALGAAGGSWWLLAAL